MKWLKIKKEAMVNVIYTLPLVIVIVIFGLLIRLSYLENTYNKSKIISSPSNIVNTKDEYLIVIEKKNLTNGSVTFDTLRVNNRVPSTLEDFESKYRKY